LVGGLTLILLILSYLFWKPGNQAIYLRYLPKDFVVMRLKFKLLFLVLLVPFLSFAGQVIVLEGNYQLRNIYVSNKILPSGVGYCITNVLVNGEVSTDEINSEAFEIDLSLFNFSIGDPISVEIHYRDDCQPDIINPLALKPQATFKTDKIALDGDVLNWEASNESGSLPFRVQQFKWNKWVTVGEVEGKGTSGPNKYKYKVNAITGRNRFRVIQKSGDGRTKVSPEVVYNSNVSQVVFEYEKKEDQIVFSRETSFEVYDAYGRIIKKGYNKSIDVTDLEKGKKSIYYINYDNTFAEFSK